MEQGGDQPETFSDLTVPATREWGKPESGVYTVHRDGSVKGGPVAMTIGSPARGNPKELFTQLSWHLDLPAAGHVLARLGQVCSGATLQVSLDGKVCLDRKLTAGAPGKGPWKSARRLEQWNVWVSDYDQDLVIAVPAGRHELTFACTEGDWLQVRSLVLPGYRSSRYPQVDALGLGSESQLLLWFHNQESTWRTEYDHKRPGMLEPASRPGARGRRVVERRVVGHQPWRGAPARRAQGVRRRPALVHSSILRRPGGASRPSVQRSSLMPRNALRPASEIGKRDCGPPCPAIKRDAYDNAPGGTEW